MGLDQAEGPIRRGVKDVPHPNRHPRPPASDSFLNPSRRAPDTAVLPQNDYTFPFVIGPVPSPPDVNNTGQSQSQREQTLTAADGPVPLVYGTMQVGAKVADVKVYSGDLYIQAAICAGEMASLNSYTFNRLDPSLISHDKEILYGTSSGTASTLMGPAFLASYGFIPKFPGLGWLAFKFPAAATGFDGIPEIRMEVKGKKVLDSRENLALLSENYTMAAGVTLSSGSAPTVTATANLWGESKAATWDFTGGAGVIQKTTGTATTVNGTSVVASFWAKLVSGSGAVTATVRRNGPSDAEATAITINDQWRRYTITHSTTWTGTTKPELLLSFASGCIVKVFGFQIEKKSSSYGYIATTTSEITANTAWSNNPALCLADLLTDTDNGVGIPISMLDLESFGNSAHICETQRNGANRFTLNAAFSQQSSADEIIKSILITCNGDLYVNEGKYTLFVDAEQEYVVAQFDEDDNCRNTQIWREETIDSPTRVTVQFPNAANDYATDSVFADMDGVDTGLVELREALYTLSTISSSTYANRIAQYIRKYSGNDLRAALICSPLGITLKRGDLVEVTAKNGLSAEQFLVMQIDPLANKEYAVSLRKYDEDIYDDGTYGGDTVIPPSEGSTDVGYLDAWFGWAGSTYPYNAASTTDYTVSGNEDWSDAAGYRRYRTLTINGSCTVTIKKSPFYIFADVIDFAATTSIISASGQAGTTAPATFGAYQANGGTATNGTAIAQGGCGGGMLFVVCNTIRTAAGVIRANGGIGAENGNVTADLVDGGQGAFSRRVGVSTSGSYEDWAGGFGTTAASAPFLWTMCLGDGGDATNDLGGKAGGAGGRKTTATLSAGGGSGIGGGAGGVTNGGSPIVAPGPLQILELSKYGCLGGGGGGALTSNGGTNYAGGGGGGSVVVWAKTLSSTPTLSATGGAGTSGSGNGADGVSYLIQV